MRFPKPTFQFIIPSVYDKTPLDCRIYRPCSIDPNSELRNWGTRGAIVAHPYAALGGCYDDSVVKTVVEVLINHGYTVLTFNFRGAGDSKGRTSWTAKPELGDYISMIGFMLHCLVRLANSGQELNCFPSDMNVELVLAGYSYGSMIVSVLPGIDQIIRLFESHPAEASINSIASKAIEVSGMMVGKAIRQSSSNRPGKPEHEEVEQTYQSVHNCVDLIHPYVSYLLISPILPPVSMFVSMSWLPGTSTDITLFGQKLSAGTTEEQLSSSPTLVIYADNDMFTSIKKLRPWIKKLKDIPRSKFSSREIVGAGHFWTNPETQRQMREAIGLWIGPQTQVGPQLGDGTSR